MTAWTFYTWHTLVPRPVCDGPRVAGRPPHPDTVHHTRDTWPPHVSPWLTPGTWPGPPPGPCPRSPCWTRSTWSNSRSLCGGGTIVGWCWWSPCHRRNTSGLFWRGLQAAWGISCLLCGPARGSLYNVLLALFCFSNIDGWWKTRLSGTVLSKGSREIKILNRWNINKTGSFWEIQDRDPSLTSSGKFMIN